MAELALQNLTKTFGGARGFRALDNLTLAIRSGELLALLGPSGSGKSTLLRLVAGLDEPTSGTILLDGKPLNGVPAAAREAAMAFQFPALLPQLTVLENLRLGPRLRKVPAAESTARVKEAAGLLGIDHLLERNPETLSGGEQQRVALARAIVARPKLLLLDEPLANLDPISRIELRNAIRALQRQLQVTAIYVTHDQSEAVAVGHRLAILHRGTLQQTGTPSELYENPESLFVARFFGPSAMNVLEGKITRAENGAAMFETGRGEIRLPLRNGLAQTSETVMAAFRPSAVRPGSQGFAARVAELIDHGWKKLAVLHAGGLSIHMELPEGRIAVPGETALFQVDPFFLFDSAGKRIPPPG